MDILDKINEQSIGTITIRDTRHNNLLGKEKRLVAVTKENKKLKEQIKVLQRQFNTENIIINSL